jgi:hypothetical protein
MNKNKKIQQKNQKKEIKENNEKIIVILSSPVK